MKKSIYTLFIFVLSVLFTACTTSTDSGDDGGGGGGGGGTDSFTLTTAVEPSGAGSVNPSSGTFDDGTEVTVEASENEGWVFSDWTGTLQSSDNPFTFTINQNTNLTANFLAVNSVYTMELTVTDSLNSQVLRFGQDPNGTEGFDSGLDVESPPPPPQGALNSFFKNGGIDYLTDIRSFTDTTITWNFQFQIGAGDSLSLSWALTDTRMNGTLTIANSDSSILVDMLSEQNLSFNQSEADSLFIEYRLNLP